MSDYGLDPMFERIVAQMLATNPAFYRRVGKHLSTDIIQDSAAKTVIDACRINRQNLARVGGESPPPSSSVIVRQRLRSIHDAGKLSEEERLCVRQ